MSQPPPFTQIARTDARVAQGAWREPAWHRFGCRRNPTRPVPACPPHTDTHTTTNNTSPRRAWVTGAPTEAGGPTARTPPHSPTDAKPPPTPPTPTRHTRGAHWATSRTSKHREVTGVENGGTGGAGALHVAPLIRLFRVVHLLRVRKQVIMLRVALAHPWGHERWARTPLHDQRAAHTHGRGAGAVNAPPRHGHSPECAACTHATLLRTLPPTHVTLRQVENRTTTRPGGAHAPPSPTW